MSVAMYFKNPISGEDEIMPLVGASELKAVWMPIVTTLDLHHLDYCFTAGLQIDCENRNDLLEEFKQLWSSLAPSEGKERCKAAIELISSDGPQLGSLYIG